MFKRLVVGLDESTAAARAFEIAVNLASESQGNVHVVSVEDRLPMFAATISETVDEDRRETFHFRRVQSSAIRQMQGRSLVCDVSFAIHRGRVAEQLARVARERDADLLVIGTARHSAMHDALLGSTPRRVLKKAPCPVLVIPDRGD